MKPYKFHFVEKESDITIISESEAAISKARDSFYNQRKILEKYTSTHKNFLTSFSPVSVDTQHKIIQIMAKAATICDVGPMAAVAGALADLMMEAMKGESPNYDPPKIALVENGGEIIIDSEKSMKIALYAGYNDLNINIGFLVKRTDCPLGIGTSSAKIGHAVSLGDADAVTVFADNATLADAAATRIANAVNGDDIERSIQSGLEIADDLVEIRGAFINRENHIGTIGKVPKMVKIEGDSTELIKGKLKSLSQKNL